VGAIFEQRHAYWKAINHLWLSNRNRLRLIHIAVSRTSWQTKLLVVQAKSLACPIKVIDMIQPTGYNMASIGNRL
jgi:hypothetical protein